MNKNGVGFVHVDDFDAIFGEDDVGFEKDIFKSGHEGAKRCDLEGLNGENISRIVIMFGGNNIIVHL